MFQKFKEVKRCFSTWWYRYCFRLAANEVRNVISYYENDLSEEDKRDMESLAKLYDTLGKQ